VLLHLFLYLALPKKQFFVSIAWPQGIFYYGAFMINRFMFLFFIIFFSTNILAQVVDRDAAVSSIIAKLQELEEKTQALKAAEAKIAELEEVLVSQKQKLAAQEDRIAELLDIQNNQRNTQTALETEVRVLREELASLKSNNQRLIEENTSLSNARSASQALYEKEQERLKTQTAAMAALEKTLSETQKNLAAANSNIANLNNALNAEKAAVAKQQGDLQAKDALLQERALLIQQLETTLENIRKLLKSSEEEKDKLQQSLNEKSNEVVRLEQKNNELTSAFNDLNEKFLKSESALASAKGLVNTLTEEKAALEGRLTEQEAITLQLRKDLTFSEDKRQQLGQTVENYDANLIAAQERIKNLEQSQSSIAESLRAAEAELASARADAAAREAQQQEKIKELESAVQALDSKFLASENLRQALEKDLAFSERKRQELGQTIENYDAALLRAEADRSVLAEKNRQLTENIKQISDEFAAYRAQATQLQAKQVAKVEECRVAFQALDQKLLAAELRLQAQTQQLAQSLILPKAEEARVALESAYAEFSRLRAQVLQKNDADLQQAANKARQKVLLLQMAIAYETNAQGVYTVVAGDTLGNIAKKIYGNARLWPRIQEANAAVLPNPNLLLAGNILLIP
jgi:nucleoid-associated protein YgaU